MRRKKDQMSEEVKTSIGTVGAADIAPDEPPCATNPFAPGGAFDPAKGHVVEVCIRNAKSQLDHDYPEQSRAKSMVHTKLDEAALWLIKVGSPLLLLLCFSCGGLAIVRDKLASYGDELAVFCPQTNISQDCIDARRRYEVGTAAVQTATLGEQINRDAQNLITQADTVVGAALEWFKTKFLK